MIKKALAGASIALALLIATPVAANAVYVPAENATVSDSTPAPGQAVTVAFANESFTAGESVSFSVTGEGAVTIAAITTASVTKVASAAGAASAVVTPPANATGTYTVTATGLSSGRVGTAALTVVAVSADGTAVTLPFTGGTLPIAAIWIAGGVLVLGVVLLSVVGIRRRSAAQGN
jgi:hypothetical protein